MLRFKRMYYRSLFAWRTSQHSCPSAKSTSPKRQVQYSPNLVTCGYKPSHESTSTSAHIHRLMEMGLSTCSPRSGVQLAISTTNRDPGYWVTHSQPVSQSRPIHNHFTNAHSKQVNGKLHGCHPPRRNDSRDLQISIRLSRAIKDSHQFKCPRSASS